MESYDGLKAAVVTACVFVAAACMSAVQIYRRRWQREVGVGRRRCSELEDKPQNCFKRVLADNSYAPFNNFKREGKEKEISLKIHPYQDEINVLLEHPPLLTRFLSNHPNSDIGDSYLWITTEHQLEFLAETLSKEKVFAVDTEQHSLRSFLGFTALMQISTQKEDFLLDTIALHDVMGILQPVFADPSICKVFHGADNDTLWLQRDFHIYVVNMFDTAKACEVLSKPQKSLAFLLETYCGVLTDKSLQIVKAYFGGREVLPEDLETALLVGMSPHERKRLRKKRGLSFRHNKECDPQGNDPSAILGTVSKSQLENYECSLEERLEDKSIVEINLELRNMSNHLIQGIPLVEQNSTESTPQIDERNCLGRDVFASGESSGNGIPEQQKAASSQSCKSDQGYSSRRANRLSFLGHGHHGKEVVKILLREHGEGGISQFCQKWRQVFVEGVNPRFLPRGWDIMHSGRRDFGEFSVYNPAKKNAAA